MKVYNFCLSYYLFGNSRSGQTFYIHKWSRKWNERLAFLNYKVLVQQGYKFNKINIIPNTFLESRMLPNFFENRNVNKDSINLRNDEKLFGLFKKSYFLSYNFTRNYFGAIQIIRVNFLDSFGPPPPPLCQSVLFFNTPP